MVMTRRQSEIEEKLDLTKNQAPGQMEAISAGEEQQKVAEFQSPAEVTRHARRALKVAVASEIIPRWACSSIG